MPSGLGRQSYQGQILGRAIPPTSDPLWHGKAIFIVAYQMLLNNEDYKEMGESYFDIQNKPKVVNHLVRRLTNLGFYVTLQPGAEPLSPDNVARNIETIAERTSVSPTPPQLSVKRGRGRPCKCASRGIDCKHKYSSKYSPRRQRTTQFPAFRRGVFRRTADTFY